MDSTKQRSAAPRLLPTLRRSAVLRRRARGFTLVELMIAMVLVGVLTAMIYGLFTRTSDSLSDVENLSQTLDKARFALAFVRADVQAAGSQATPNSRAGGISDPWVQPPNPNQLVQAIRVYNGWTGEGSRDLYMEAGGDGEDDVETDLGARNPESAFHGIVLLGAFDFPMSFYGENVTPAGEGATFSIMGNERGLGRLIRHDPFDVSISNIASLGDTGTRLERNMGHRVVRIMDGQGYMQFSEVAGINATNVPAVLTAEEVAFREGQSVAGLELFQEDDVSVDLALLDAYWYRVRVDPQDGTNFQLVRDRIDASWLIEQVGTLDSADLLGHINGLGNNRETLIVADNVVDFRIWFECIADGIAPTATVWPTEWDIQDGDGGCLNPDGANSQPERARVAHLRLSLRTPRENPNRPHFDMGGQIPLGFEEEDGQMVTYEIFTHATGAASVVTVQTSVELTNLAMRGLR